MTTVDERIRGALSAEDEAFLEALDRERGMFQQLGDGFRGTMGRWMGVVYIFALAITAIGVWAATRLFATSDLRETMLWLGAIGLAVFATAMLKLWIFGRMNTLTILRELKRIEVRVAQLEER